MDNQRVTPAEAFQARVLAKCAKMQAASSQKKRSHFQRAVMQAAEQMADGGDVLALQQRLSAMPEYKCSHAIQARAHMEEAIGVYEEVGETLEMIGVAHQSGMSAGALFGTTNPEILEQAFERMRGFIQGNPETGDIVEISLSSGKLTHVKNACLMHQLLTSWENIKDVAVEKLRAGENSARVGVRVLAKS